jgi:hypothetical protein
VFAAVVLQRRRLPHLSGAPRVLGVAVLATAALIAAHLAPGMAGVLSRWSALAVALALAAAAWRVPGVPIRRGHDPPPPPPESERSLSWALAAVAAGAVVLWLVASAWNRTVLPPEGIDTLTFHFPDVGKWIREGSIWRVDQFTPLLTNGNYPHNGDVVFLAAILPWRNDWLAGAVNPLYVALAGIAVYALARELGAPRPPAILAGALFASLPVVGLAANGEGMTDSLMFATLGAGMLFLLRHERGAPLSELVLAGLALGLAFGTKWYSLWAVAAVVAVWVGVRLIGRLPPRKGPNPLFRDVGLVAGLIALAGGVWLLRNWIDTGNPVFPVEVGALGVTVFDAPYDYIRACAGFTIAHYAGDGGVWSDHILPAYRDTYAWPGAAIGLGLVAAVALALRARGGVPRGALAAGLGCTLLLTAGYVLTPYSAFGPEGEPVLVGANARYLVPALLAAAPLAAWALGRAGRLRLPVELAAAAAVAAGIDRSFDVPLHVVLAVLAVLAALAGAGWLALIATGRLPGRARTPARLAAAALAAGGLVAVGHARQDEFNDGRYESGDAAIAWIARHARSGHRIGLAGVWSVDGRSPVWPAMGERLGNEVDFVGPYEDERLREYDNRAAWTAAIRRGRYDLLLVGRGGYSDECPVPGQDSDDDAWARAEGFRVLARSDRLTLYRVERSRTIRRRPTIG